MLPKRCSNLFPTMNNGDSLQPDDSSRTIAILGGTGDLGTGLAKRWIRSGHRVIIGSRRLDKAREAVTAQLGNFGEMGQVEPATNEQAVELAEIVVLTVPFAHQSTTLQALRELLQHKLLIDTTVPLMPPRVGTVQLPAKGSAALCAQRILGPDVRLVSAFQNVSAQLLQSDADIDCDVLVSSDDRAAAREVIELVKHAGMHGYDAGPLANAVVAEALTSVLIRINKQFKCHSGVRITGPAQ